MCPTYVHALMRCYGAVEFVFSFTVAGARAFAQLGSFGKVVVLVYSKWFKSIERVAPLLAASVTMFMAKVNPCMT